MTILELIQKACKSKGVPEKYAERIQKTFKIEKAEGMEAFVDLFKENILPAIEDAEKIAKTTAEEEAKKKAIEEYEKAHGLKDGKIIDSQEPDTSKLSPEVKALLEAQKKQLEEMKELVEKSAKSAKESAATEKAKSLLKDAKLPEGWINRVLINSETPLEDQVKALSEEYITIRQAAINEAVANGDYAPGAVELPDRSEADWQKLMDSEETPNNPGTVDLGLGK